MSVPVTEDMVLLALPGVQRCQPGLYGGDYWRGCPTCPARISVGDVQGIAPVRPGYRDWVCRTCLIAALAAQVEAETAGEMSGRAA